MATCRRNFSFISYGLIGERSHLAGVRAFTSSVERAVAGQFEAKADSAEVRCHSGRWRSLSALRQSMQIREYAESWCGEIALYKVAFVAIIVLSATIENRN